jgi:hypothetical protein
MIETETGTMRLLEHIFRMSIRHRGAKITRQMFKKLSGPPTSRQLKQIEKLEWLLRLNRMPKPSIRQLARDLLAEQGIGSDSRKFQNKFESLVMKIRRAKNKPNKQWAEFEVLRLTNDRIDPAGKYQVVNREKTTIRKPKKS